MSREEGNAARVLEGQGGLRVRLSELRTPLHSADTSSDGAGEASAAVIQLLDREREKNKLSVSALAKKCGMTRQQLSKLLNGSGNPTLTTTCRIAEALGLDVTLSLKA